MSSEQNKAVIRRFIDEVFNSGNVIAIDELVADNVVDHVIIPGLAPGKEGFKQRAAFLLQAFPDLRITIEDQLEEDGKVVGRYTVRGTHKGDFMGIPATGKSIQIGAMDVIRVKDGQMVEHWGQFDMLGMFQQLGLAPSP